MADNFAGKIASLGLIGGLFVEMGSVRGADKLQRRIDQGLDVNLTDHTGRTLLM
ncbi:MAG: hypothetical protein LAP61_23140 [Acidobacteriia bacterium]|nr:hypothetical protein [Terriglobia bacterium]